MGQVGGFNEQAADIYRQRGKASQDEYANSRLANLAARGISDINSGAGTNMMRQLGTKANDFELGALGAGIQQGNTMFGQQNDLHKMGVNDILSQKQANLGQLSGMFGLGQQMGVPQYNSFNQGTTYQTPDLMGAASKGYEAQVAQANAKNAGKSNLLGGLMGIAGTALGGPIGGAIGTGIGGLFGGSGGSSAGSYDASTWK